MCCGPRGSSRKPSPTSSVGASKSGGTNVVGSDIVMVDSTVVVFGTVVVGATVVVGSTVIVVVLFSAADPVHAATTTAETETKRQKREAMCVSPMEGLLRSPLGRPVLPVDDAEDEKMSVPVKKFVIAELASAFGLVPGIAFEFKQTSDPVVVVEDVAG